MTATRRRLIWTTAVAAVALVAAACQPTPYDFTGDHVADYGWMDDTGSFYLVGDPNPIFTPATVTQADFPLPVPGDWDGDNKTEPAVASAETGVWETPDGTFTYAPADLDPAFDAATIEIGRQWIPVPANWDKTDKAWEPAWFREDDATWFIQGRAPIQYGTGANGFVSPPGDPYVADALAWDVPVPLDFDNDGEADIAVYRPLDGTYRTANDGIIATLGLGYPAPADYVGDRAPEPAIYQSFPGEWLIDGTAPVSQPNTFSSPIPAAADYDGDKKADPTLFGWYTGDFAPADAPLLAAPEAAQGWSSGAPAWQVLTYIQLAFLIQECLYPLTTDCPSGITPPP